MKFLRLNQNKNFTTSLIVILLFTIGFLIYINSLHNQMFWDDDDFILKNRYIQDWQYWPKYFSENVIAGNSLLSNYWRPILLSLFSLQWHLWKAWPLGYHLTSILVHSADSVLLYFLINLLFTNRRLAFLTALFFLVHPIHTEAVVYANAISDPLACFFILLGLIFYVRSRQSLSPGPQFTFYCLSLLTFLLALMSKETAFMMPGYVILIEGLLWLKDHESKEALTKASKAQKKKPPSTGKFYFSKKDLINLANRLAPFAFTAIVYLILRATVLNFVNTFNFYNEDTDFTLNFHIRLLTFFRVLTTYFGLMLFPIDLHVERSVPQATSLFSLSVCCGAVILGIMIFTAVRSWKKNPLILFGVAWFFIGLFPSSNLIIPINSLLYEHFLYMPMMGVFLIFSYWLIKWIDLFKMKEISVGLLAAYILFFCVRTVIRNADWKDAVIFYENLLNYAPKSYRVINNLGMMYADRQQYDKAENIYKRAIDLDPTNPVAYHNLAGTFRDTGRTQLAIQSFEKALQLNPGFVFSYRSLSRLYLDLKEYGKAREVLERYIEHSENPVDILDLLAQIAYEQKDFAGAEVYLKQGLVLQPNNPALKANLTHMQFLHNAAVFQTIPK